MFHLRDSLDDEGGGQEKGKSLEVAELSFF
jgi:hypothetical protein